MISGSSILSIRPLWGFIANSALLVAISARRLPRYYDPAMYSLREPLPSDIVAHAAGPFGGYRRFPIFSAPWLLGRSMLFVPLMAGLGLLEASLLGFELGDARLGWQSVAISVPTWVVIGSAGPALATLARHRLAPARVTVPVAILLGICLSFMEQHVAEVYSRAVVLLISLVENAIKHGIERSTGAGQITIGAAVETRTDAPQLVVAVVDTGAGLRASAAAGTGLPNIRDQLLAWYGAKGSLTVQDRTAGGVVATIRVPFEVAA
jgi:hypothetical protein